MKIKKISEIEVGKTYTVRLPNIFYSFDSDPIYVECKDLVLAKSKKDLICFLVDEVKLTAKEKRELLKLKRKDFLDNISKITQKYEEHIVVLDIVKNEIITCQGFVAVFLK